MGVAKDLSTLPRTRGGRDGLLPDDEPRFIQALVEAWADDNDENKPTAMGTPFRHSDAGKCARYLSYVAAGIPASDPMDLAGVWNVTLGTMIHDLWQKALQDRWPDAEVEVTCATVGADGSGHIDAVIRTDDRVTAYELKTIGGFGYKAAVGVARAGTPAEGPKREHLVQAALNGKAVDADEIVVGYLAKECISAGIAEKRGVTELERFCCEWTFDREQYEPLADEEAARVTGVLGVVDGGELARRVVPGEMPKSGEIQEPTTGAWTVERDGETEQTGKFWGCDYCSRQSLCAQLPPGRIPVESAVTVAVGLGLMDAPGEAA